MASEQSKSEARPFGNEGQRVVLLVTTPVGESFQSIARATGFRPLQSPRVNWSSHENSALPDLASRLKFTTHYALCVIDREIWEKTSVSLLEKFRRARFWDHPGDYTMMAPSRSSQSNSCVGPAHLNACRIWCDADIGNIESGQEIGQTDTSDEEISRVYMELRQDWTYMPVFWNCHDLAIRLAHIIVPPSVNVTRFLKVLIVLLRRAYNKEVNWFSTAEKVSIGGWAAAGVGGVAAVPPLAVAGVGVFMVGWSVGFFGGFMEVSKEKTRHNFMIKLEERFPQLRSLHH
ncbi:hypothetical protein BKA61DRAFT_585261 [Leptodontidium sp. MPI-SDFR-AT-0119]|nr:hypothetical protein BKA61DRAFT_585261 [Leptodontidium sp. MPI-SDFR-AT-0119]